MVYIGLDEESRTKGKAAIDVVGAQTGKSTSSVLQQVCTPNRYIPAYLQPRYLLHNAQVRNDILSMLK